MDLYRIRINGQCLDNFGEMNPDDKEAQPFVDVQEAISYLMDCELDLEIDEIKIEKIS